ncbi:speckle-type POZ protein [Caerostris darwini]|uniref:Speckle-type POZ protein n=1 Tax=Caerostris darwini TaxID=1538125 RepID=A0AAV4W0Q1_9ARAC|nr:speckle-type POZ protein [Caerostris darwini]
MTDINSGEKGFTFTWRIKNISYCWHNRGDVLVSPTFSVADLQHSSWSLLLYPRGHANEDGYLSVVLRREKTGGPETLTPSFELSLISTDGSSLLSFYVEEGEVFFSKNYNNDFNGDGTYKFVTREEVFCSKKSIYLPSDTLTVCCRMWKERCVDRTVHMFAKTVINTETCFSHEVLHKLLGHSKVITVTSSKGCPVLSIDVSSWSESHLKKDISATITNKRSLENGPFNCDLYFVHTSGEKIKCGEIDNRFEEHINDTWELNLWFPKTLLIDKNFECLTEDWFLQCEGIFGTKSKTANIERIVYGIPSNLAVDMIREFPGTPSVLDDLKSIYLDKIFCDVTLSTQTAKFKAHKTILCARSDVFKSLLTNKRSNSIEIEDFDDDTVQSLLMFLYTDTTEDMQWSMANKLYKAAIYYKVHLLKWRCSDILMENLNAHNAIEALVLTNEYQDTNLRSAVDTFILAHDEDIFVSEEWMAFTQTHPQLAMKTMILKYEIKKKKKERICSTDTSTDCDSTDSDISTMVFTETENSEKLSSGIRKELDDYPNIVEDLNTLYDLQEDIPGIHIHRVHSQHTEEGHSRNTDSSHSFPAHRRRFQRYRFIIFIPSTRTKDIPGIQIHHFYSQHTDEGHSGNTNSSYSFKAHRRRHSRNTNSLYSFPAHRRTFQRYRFIVFIPTTHKKDISDSSYTFLAHKRRTLQEYILIVFIPSTEEGYSRITDLSYSFPAHRQRTFQKYKCIVFIPTSPKDFPEI